MNISLVVLCYNDAPALPDLVEGLDRVLGRVASRHEILLVDDHSADGTPLVCAELAARFPSVRPLRRERNGGVGAAFRTGAEAASFEVIGYTDGDGQYRPEDVEVLAAALQEAEAASGWRVRRADPRYRNVVSAVYNGLLRILYGLPLRDTNSGLKLYRREFLEAARPLVSDGPFYDAEILIKGRAAGFRVAEVPIGHLPRRFGQAGGATAGNIRRTLREMVQDFMAPYVHRHPISRLVHALLRRYC